MRVVAIGGGTGLSALLRGLKRHRPEAHPSGSLPTIDSITAIVTVTDEGGSSGRLRRDFRMLPPGDIRNCLVALAGDETLFAKLFNYRFRSGGGLRGHNFGNLFLTALTHVTRDFGKALRLTSEILAVRGEIFPSTLSDVHLKAKLADGRIIYGESRITRTHVPIARLSIIPSRCRPLPEALAAIRAADLITLGPGSLYTSLIPNLLVKDIASEIARSKALRVYIGNLMTQPGETRRYTQADHLAALQQHAGHRVFDVMVLNSSPISASMRKRYAAYRAEPVMNDIERVERLGVCAVEANLLAADHVARHDPARVARLLLELTARRKPLRRAGAKKRARA